jgi:hypothetical protein
MIALPRRDSEEKFIPRTVVMLLRVVANQCQCAEHFPFEPRAGARAHLLSRQPANT